MKKKLQFAALLLTTTFISFAELPDPWKTKEYSVIEIDGRFAAYIGIHPIILDSELKKKSPKTYLEAIEAFGPAFTSRLSSAGIWEWHFSDQTVYTTYPRWSGTLAAEIKLRERESTELHSTPSKSIKANKTGEENSK